MRTFTLTLGLALLAGCGVRPPATDPGPMRPAGLYALPARIAFTCVTPGCDETGTTRITVSGDRRVAIKRILLTGGAASDFSFTTLEKAPFIVGTASSFDVEVKFVPRGAPLAGVAELRVTFTDAAADESPDRLMAGELVIPLVRRLVGQPELTVTPGLLSFGVVEKGKSKTLPLTVTNTGFGNVVLEVTGIDAGTAALTASLPMVHSLVSDAGFTVPVSWAPTTETFLSATIEVGVATPGVAPGLIRVEGTSLTQPQLAFDPSDTLDFGEVVKGLTRKLPVTLYNQGGLALVVSRVTSDELTGSLKATLGDGGTVDLGGGSLGLAVAPLGRVPFVLGLDAGTPGEIDATLSFTTNEPGSGLKLLHVKATVTEPRATATPAMLDFGTVPMGWVVNKTIEVKNTGFGSLTLKNLSFVAGSHIDYVLVNKPALPMEIKRDARVAFDVQLTAGSQSAHPGWVSIETDDPITPFVEVTLTATVGSCAAGCPIANGTPSCTTGSCTVGTCNAGFYDTDNAGANGCECKEIGTDPGEFCVDSTYVGSLKDNDHVSTSFTGIVPLKTDVDLVRFYGEDASAFFDENFKVKVRLVSSDPAISMCVYRANSASHQSDCFFSNETCPASRYYEKGGSLGPEDGADFIVKVYRTASSTATCTPYTVFMSNGQ